MSGLAGQTDLHCTKYRPETGDWEEGLYQYFDVKAWMRMPGWFRLKYEELAERKLWPDCIILDSLF